MCDKPLYLKRSSVQFKPPSKSESVFFDECNREVISLSARTGSKPRALFQSVDEEGHVIELFLPVDKKILSIKLNPNASVLAYHSERSTVEFFNVKISNDQDEVQKYTLEERRYVQSTRAKNSKLIGFLWTSTTEVVMITDIDVEYFSVDASWRRLRHLKSFTSSTNWFVYQPQPKFHVNPENESRSPYSVLMVSTGSLSSSMQPYLFRKGQIHRLQKFDVEGDWQGGERLELFERSITISFLYGLVRLLVLQHESLNLKSRGAQILVYTVDPISGLTSKTHTLDLDVSGRFAISIHDNLVIVHDEPSKSSSIFDIMIKSTEKSDCAGHFVSLIGSQPMKGPEPDELGKTIQMYSVNWVFFQPNFIIDAKLGILSILHIDLDVIESHMQENNLLLSFLANREGSERIILNKMKDIVGQSLSQVAERSHTSTNPLTEVSSAIEIVAQLVTPSTSDELNGSGVDQDRKNDVTLNWTTTSLSQEEIQREVFQQFDITEGSNPARAHFVISTLLEFIFALRRQEKDVSFCIYELLVRILLQEKQYYQLVQMIRCGILRDSKKLACLLLSGDIQYKPAVDIGMNMLQRLDCITELVSSISL